MLRGLRAGSNRPNPLRRATAGAAGALSLLAIALPACTDEPVGLDWQISFATPELGERARIIEARLARGGCGSSEVIYSATLSRGGEGAPAPGALDPGPYGAAVRAADASCHWFAAACATVLLPPDDDGPLEVVLDRTDEEPYCEGGLCTEGVCDPDGVVDATMPDGEGVSDPGGPLTLLVSHFSLRLDRDCDLDGDGVGDNALAELGPVDGSLLALAIESKANGDIEEMGRHLFHFPWVDNRASPRDDELTCVFFQGIDEDRYVEGEGLLSEAASEELRADDFDGGEGFFARPADLDACGEPRFSYPGGRMEPEGIAFEGGGTPVPISRGELPLNDARFFGSVAAFGASADIRICGVSTIHDLGPPKEDATADELTYLEMFAAGGTAYGLPSLPGISPDVDLDGDGLERMVTDGSGKIELCLDGDLTEIAGRDCWMDPRMADGFALTFGLDCVSARFSGRLPGWEDEVEGSCDAPPEESVFDER